GLLPIGEARVAQSGADSQYAPSFHVLHEWYLAQALHHGIVVNQHSRVMLADLGNGFAQARGKIEIAALPVARKILRAAIDRAILLDTACATDADEGRQPKLFFLRARDELQ